MDETVAIERIWDKALNAYEVYMSRHDLNPSRPTGIFWERVIDMDSNYREDLEAARASRNRAESSRQETANHILEATREVCQRLMADAERALGKARDAEAQTEAMRMEAQKELDASKAAKSEGEALRDGIVDEARREAKEITEQARADARREAEGLKAQAAAEAERNVAQSELIREAAKEELEAQRIYTEASRMKVESQHVLSQLSEDLALVEVPPAARVNGDGPVAEEAKAEGDTST
jgi:hypothetical protein